jgi:2-oxoglutarate dehydrogenase E2 component (dihydrolipoamide succinyltransferase)
VTEVAVPKVNSNDASYVLLDWLCPTGARVAVGEPIAVLETSKAAHELVAEQAGILHHAMAAGAECDVGDAIGYLFTSEEERNAHLGADPGPVASAAPEPLVTDAARELARLSEITAEQLRQLGRPVIRRSDVEALLSQDRPPAEVPAPRDTAAAAAPTTTTTTTTTGRLYQATRGQRAVAEVVSQSHQAIPAAFTAVRVRTSAVSQLRHEPQWGMGGPPGLLELLIKAVAGTRESFPLFFAVRDEQDDSVYLPDAAHVGVTIDVGAGLYVPVIRNAADRRVGEIGEQLTDFRHRARIGEFQDDQLRGANIVVTVHDYTDVEFAVPLIYPGQTCALSIAGPGTELHSSPSGEISAIRFFRLGVAYDHRMVNGRDAVLFAKEIKAALERPERLQALSS